MSDASSTNRSLRRFRLPIPGFRFA